MSGYRVVHQEVKGRSPCEREVVVELLDDEEKRCNLPALGGDQVLMFGQVPRVEGTKGADELVCHGMCESCRV